MRETASTTLHAKRVLAEGTNSEIEMGQAEESTLKLLVNKHSWEATTFYAMPDTYRYHLEKSLLPWDQWTWVLKETDLELMI